jgi:hypothetical protein
MVATNKQNEERAMSHQDGQIERDFIVKCSGMISNDGQCYDAGADDIGMMVPDMNQPRVNGKRAQRWASILEGLPPEYANMVKLNINSILEDDMATELAWKAGE